MKFRSLLFSLHIPTILYFLKSLLYQMFLLPFVCRCQRSFCCFTKKKHQQKTKRTKKRHNSILYNSCLDTFFLGPHLFQPRKVFRCDALPFSASVLPRPWSWLSTAPSSPFCPRMTTHRFLGESCHKNRILVLLLLCYYIYFPLLYISIVILYV